MRMALTVYREGKPVKEYEADEARLTAGVCMDVMAMTRADLLMDEDADSRKEVARSVVKSFGEFGTVCKQVFPGLTDEEFRDCLPGDVAEVMWSIVSYALDQLSGVNPDQKKPQPTRKPRQSRKRCSGSWSPSGTAIRPSTL